jgi:2'-5' RNA ligase
MRLFLAINLPAALRTQIHADIEPMRRAGPGVAWIHPEHLHFTLKFLGEVAPDAVSPLRETVGKASRGQEPCLIKMRGVGAFPNFRRPRVVWIGVKDHGPLAMLAGRVQNGCVTVGRVKRELDAIALQSLERSGGRMHNEYPLEVRSVELMQSELRADGPRYTILASLPLGGIT